MIYLTVKFELKGLLFDFSGFNSLDRLSSSLIMSFSTEKFHSPFSLFVLRDLIFAARNPAIWMRTIDSTLHLAFVVFHTSLFIRQV